MSIAFSINIKIDSDENIRCKEIICLLINGGWNVIKKGEISFLPLNDDDMFNWTISNISMDKFIEIVDQKEDAKELIGVEVVWLDSGIGGHLLLHSGNDFSIEMNINIKYMQNELKIPDFNWYAQKIINIIKTRYHILEYNFEVIY